MLEMTLANTDTDTDADRYEALAADRSTRAERIRRRAAGIPAGLQPLQQAMRRRAAELELSAAALHEIATGQRAMASTTS